MHWPKIEFLERMRYLANLRGVTGDTEIQIGHRRCRASEAGCGVLALFGGARGRALLVLVFRSAIAYRVVS
jgi:hypothetical protein